MAPGNSGCDHNRFINGLELGEYKKHSGYCNNCTYHDGQGYHVALVLPIGYLAGRTTTAKESMGIHFLTITAGSHDGFEHLRIVTLWQLFAIDLRQRLLPDEHPCWSINPDLIES